MIEKIQIISYDTTEELIVFEDLLISQLYEKLPQYSKEDIFYAVFNLEQAGYITASIKWIYGNPEECIIHYMTFMEHEFLNQIRNNSIWHKIKEGCAKVGSNSINTMSQIALSLIASLIKQNISIHNK